MKTDLSSSPSPERRDIEAEIVSAEQAVIERDHRLRVEAGVFGQRLRRQTRRTARLFGATAIGGFVLGWFMAQHSARPRVDGDSRRERHHRAPRLGDAPWAGMVPLLWPLLPLALRSRVTPGVASFLTGIGLPLVARRLSKRAHAKLAERQQEHARSGDGHVTLH